MQQVEQDKEIPSHASVTELAEDADLKTTRAKFLNVLKRHGELTERLSRDSDKTVFERLQKEFEDARASQTQEIFLEGEQWNDGLLATIRERAHMEAERKVMRDTGIVSNHPVLDKITYRVGNKIICCLGGARIGIQYDTSFAGQPCEQFHCVLESKSFLEKMIVVEHTVPFFLPISEAENDFLSSNAMKFIDRVGELLQAYVDRREQVRLIKELYGDQIGELYFNLLYNMTEFMFSDYNCKVTVSIRYPNLDSTLPSLVNVLAWPQRSSASANGKETGDLGTKIVPARLIYAEKALRTMSLPEAFAEIVLKLPQVLKEIFPEQSPS